MPRTILVLFVAAALLPAQGSDAAYPVLQQAYEALRQKQYDQAIDAFRRALTLRPDRGAVHKDLAYTLLKVGETEAARDEFAVAMQQDAGDATVALEYAFLCHETKQTAEARRVFDRLRHHDEATVRATAEQAFGNIDGPLAEGIERWTAALERTPDNFSAHLELARLAEQRDELPLAAQHYERAWHIKPLERSLLLDLGRVWQRLHKPEDSFLALLAASRGAEPRTAEAARARMPARYPYVYEFQQALALDPANVELRRELAYLRLQMGQKQEAEACFRQIVADRPDDLLSTAQLGFLLLERQERDAAQPLLERVLKGDDDELADRVRQALKLPQTLRRRAEIPRATVSFQARELADRSMKAGYLNDALKYLRIAHENDPVDFDVMRQLGWVYNILHQDQEAVKWFGLARRSSDETISAESEKAYRNLRASEAAWRTTLWAFPIFSSRWHDLFGYGQLKTEYRIAGVPIRPYVSVRFIGDTRGEIGTVQPQYLSESAFIAGAGLTTDNWRGARVWFEAGEAIRYRSDRKDVGFMIPDYRGGVSFARGMGRASASGKAGLFAETNDDGLFLSRFDKDWLLYSQNRFGYTLPALGILRSQFFLNANGNVDAKRQYWANTVEFGPGVRFRVEGMPPGLMLSVSLLRGVYTINDGNPRRPNFNDVRAGVWYGFTR